MAQGPLFSTLRIILQKKNSHKWMHDYRKFGRIWKAWSNVLTCHLEATTDNVYFFFPSQIVGFFCTSPLCGRHVLINSQGSDSYRVQCKHIERDAQSSFKIRERIALILVSICAVHYLKVKQWEAKRSPTLNLFRDFLSVTSSFSPFPSTFQWLHILLAFTASLFKSYLHMPTILPHFPLIPWLTPVWLPFPSPFWNYCSSSYLYSQFPWTFFWTYLILTFDTVYLFCHLFVFHETVLLPHQPLLCWVLLLCLTFKC